MAIAHDVKKKFLLMNNKIMKKKTIILLIILLIILIFLTIFLILKNMKKENIRPMQFAGQFYPYNKNDIASKINTFLNNVKLENNYNNIKAIIVPHAGYDYSGQVAAYSYKAIENQKIDRVFIIANSHSAYFNGIVIDDRDKWNGPFGDVEVDKDIINKIKSNDLKYQNKIFLNSNYHDNEHALEVQIPFLQTVIKNKFTIVPILFGNANQSDYKILADFIKQNLRDNDLIVISSDMSHYPSYDDAYKIDKESLDIVKEKNIDKLNEHEISALNSVVNERTIFCGIDSVRTVLDLANNLNWNVDILNYANSGDSSIGTKDQVVGYSAVVFYTNSEQASVSSSLDSNQQKILLNIAKESVENYVKNGKKINFNITDERLNEIQGAFVTINKNGQLRGCIGQIIGDKPLWETVQNMAIEACSNDYRFNPITEDELSNLEYEVSVLSVPTKINNWQDIKLGEEGVIVKNGLKTGVFLPQVATETSWDLETFLSELCSQKAGLPPDCYKSDKNVELYVFTAQVFN